LGGQAVFEGVLGRALAAGFGFRAAGFCAVDARGFGFGQGRHLVTSVDQGSGEVVDSNSEASGNGCGGGGLRRTRIVIDFAGGSLEPERPAKIDACDDRNPSVRFQIEKVVVIRNDEIGLAVHRAL
jgi:hypothetical protein